jgi:phytoene dehydrogenase-like protein
MTRYPPHEVKLRTDAEVSRPKLQRTRAEVAVLRKRHEVRKAVFVTDMVRRNLLTPSEAAQQYDDKFRRW